VSKRYTGMETCTSPEQVIRYLQENYTDKDNVPMPRAIAQDVTVKGAASIKTGIDVFRSNVEYLGDEALRNSGRTGWRYIPEADDEQD
jgi:hypothetical protein